jgi:hypothetical protein
MATWARGLLEASKAEDRLRAGSEQQRTLLRGAAALMLEVVEMVQGAAERAARCLADAGEWSRAGDVYWEQRARIREGSALAGLYYKKVRNHVGPAQLLRQCTHSGVSKPSGPGRSHQHH